MDKEILRKIGLTDNEIEIYLALLRESPCLVSRIVELTGLNRTHCYDRLEKLIGKGLANYVIKENRKYFSVTSPERLLVYLDEKGREVDRQRKQIRKMLPELLSLRKPRGKTTVEIYKGKEGFRTMLEDLLKKPGATIYSIGYTASAPEWFPFYYPQWIKRRLKAKIRRKYVVNEEVLYKSATVQPLTEVRALPKEYCLPSSTLILANKTYIYFPKEKEFVGIVIESEGIAKSHKALFKYLWKKSRKPKGWGKK